MVVKKTVTINMTIGEMRALRDNLAVIHPIDFTLEQITFLRNLYAHLDRKVNQWEEVLRRTQ